METLLKKTIKSGNASAVVLPKAWLDKRVKVELIDKTSEIILHDVLDIVKSSMDLSEIIGIYLVGSYARGDRTNLSDIDILIHFQKGKKSFDNYMDLKFFLEDLLEGHKVDLVIDDALKPALKERILETVEYAT